MPNPPIFSRFTFLLLMLPCLFFSGCGVYSFTGTTLSPDLQTISVDNFYNNSAGPANLRQTMTEKLKEYYQQNSQLKIGQADGTADLQVGGTIVGYDLSPLAPREDGLAASNRLTIRVQVKFVNTKNDEESFDSPFSFYADFPQTQSLSAVENELINTILDQIVLDVFNKTVANW